MTVAEIQGAVAMYLQRSVAKFDVSGTDANLLLVAMNNARKYAERRHNWSVCRKKGYLSVTTGNKVSWDTPTWFDAGTEKMKEGKHWWLRSTTDIVNEWNTSDVPLKVIQHGVKHVVETKRQYQAMGDEWEAYVNDTNSTCHPLLNQSHGVLRGKWLELYPRPTATTQVVVDGYCWWPNWTDAWDGGQLIRTWTFTETDIDLTDAGVYKVGFQAYPDLNTADFETVNWVANGADIALLTESNPGYATVFSSTATLADILSAINRFWPAGDVAVSSGTITVTKQGANPSLEIFTLDNTNTLVDSFTPTVASTETLPANTTSDWWTENAEEFLILRTLVECNRLGHVFTGNKEGNLPSPEKAAEQALQVLIDQDNAGELAGGQIELY
jgi:hypothetical protein